MSNNPPSYYGSSYNSRERHRADDDLEALASGSFGPVRTPNGPADLLDDSLADVPYNFAYTSADDIENENSHGGDNQSLDSSGRSEREALSREITTNSKEWVEKGTKLAEKTSQIMEDYRSYLTEIEYPSGAAGGGAALSSTKQEDKAEEYIEEVRSAYRDAYHDNHPEYNDDVSFAPPVITSGGSGGSNASGGGSSQLLKRSWAYKDNSSTLNPRYSDDPVQDVQLDIPDDSTYNTSNYNNIRNDFGMTDRRKYSNALYSKRIKRGVFTFITACFVIGLISGITSSVAKSKKEKNLPDWEAELEEVRVEAEEKKNQKSEPDHMVIGIQRPPSSPEAMNSSEEEEQVLERPVPVGIPQSENTNQKAQIIQSMTIKHEPIWYDRSSGWTGQTYNEALEFCNSRESRVPCAFEAYCPMGAGSMPFGGYREGANWALVYDAPNEWVQVGKDDSCELYSSVYGSPPQWGLTGEDNEDITRNIMCCHEPADQQSKNDNAENTDPESTGFSTSKAELTTKEQEVLDLLHPLWFGRREGYLGTTHEEARKFCKSIGDMQLCPSVAYCPNGGPDSGDGEPPLFLRLDAFKGEQWAPSDDSNSWVLVGKLNDDHRTTCSTYEEMYRGEQPEWGLDGTSTELKERVLCCAGSHKVEEIQFGVDIENPADPAPKEQNNDAVAASDNGQVTTAVATKAPVNMELLMMNKMKPLWLSPYEGWDGGSHEDALKFCEGVRGKKLCPYAAYCPNGAGQPVMGKHKVDFSKEGEQWAPVFGKDNHWIMIGQKDGDSTTTCKSHIQLEGRAPTWGLTSENSDKKLHIACCTL